MPPRGSPFFRTPGLVAAATLALAIAASVRAADPPAVQLTWARGLDADTCPAQEKIRSQVTERLGRNPFAADAPRSIDAVVDHVDGVWRAKIHVRDEQGHSLGARELTSQADDCSSIQAAAVLAIALAINPNARIQPLHSGAASASASAPPVESAPPAGIVEPPPATSRPAPQPAPSTALKPIDRDTTAASVTLRGGGTLGLLPGSTIAAGLSGSIPIARSWLVAGHALWAAVSKPSDQRFAFGLTAFGVGACYEPESSGWLQTGACAGAWLGDLQHGHGLRLRMRMRGRRMQVHRLGPSELQS